MPTIKKILDDSNLVYLYSVSWSPQGLYFKKPVNSIADMKGIKFRSYNAATARMAELSGMLPVQIEAAELSQALATGVAESFISSGATGYDTKVWEHLTHFYEVDAWLPRNTIFANKDAWKGLDDATRTVVQGCADKAKVEGDKRARAYTQFTLDGLKKGGMTVTPPSDQLRADLMKIGDTDDGRMAQGGRRPGQGHRRRLQGQVTRPRPARPATAVPAPLQPWYGATGRFSPGRSPIGPERTPMRLLRRLLDGLYLGGGIIAALCLIAILLIILVPDDRPMDEPDLSRRHRLRRLPHGGGLGSSALPMRSTTAPTSG
ncbi:MAG: TRAP transporter substrate-binding protein DctP [Burkholderiaceae bacterium]